jgi:hypothetical protein
MAQGRSRTNLSLKLYIRRNNSNRQGNQNQRKK